MRSGSVRNEPPPASTLSAPDTAPTARRASASIQEISTGQDPHGAARGLEPLGRPDLEPELSRDVDGEDPVAGGAEPQVRVDDRERAPLLHEVEEAGIDDVYAGERQAPDLAACFPHPLDAPARDVLATQEPVGVEEEEAGGLALVHGERGQRSALALRRKQLPEIDLGDDVPVVEEEGVRAAEEGRGVEHAPARLQGSLHLARDHELDAQIQRLEVGGDPLRMIVNVDDQPIRAGFHEPPGDPFQERSPADFDQRLRGIVGEGGQAGAPPGRQDHGIHVAAAVGSSARGEGQYGSSRWTSRTRTSGNRDSMCRTSFSAR